MEFHEHEAAIAWGYTLSAWQQETSVNRAKCVAHYMHRNLRDSYMAEAGDKKPETKGGYGSMLQSMGLA